MGDHTIGCGSDGDRTGRHDRLRDVIFSTGQSAGLGTRWEVSALILGTLSRSVDIYLPLWKKGTPTAFDLTIISSLQRQTLDGVARNPGHSLSIAKDRKLRAHDEAFAQGIAFIPLAMEVLGGWKGEAAEVLRELAHLSALRTCRDLATVTRHFFERLSCCLQRATTPCGCGGHQPCTPQSTL